MSKGRLLLLGRCASARNMIAKLLVNGTLDHDSISGKEESQQGEASTSSSTCSGVPVDETTPYEEIEGRGWQVVNVTAFESLVKAKGPDRPRLHLHFGFHGKLNRPCYMGVIFTSSTLRKLGMYLKQRN